MPNQLKELKMKCEETRIRMKFHDRHTCGAVAITEFIFNLINPDYNRDQLYNVVVNEMFNLRGKRNSIRDGKKFFGVPFDKLTNYYKGFGLKYTDAIIEGRRFPKNCIMFIHDCVNDVRHLVTRIDGVLYDSFDCVNEGEYRVIGFWK